VNHTSPDAKAHLWHNLWHFFRLRHDCGVSLSRAPVLCVLHLSSLSRKSEKILKAAAAKAAADGCSLASIYLFQAAKRVLRERAESF
jgi:hypothetical protein